MWEKNILRPHCGYPRGLCNIVRVNNSNWILITRQGESKYARAIKISDALFFYENVPALWRIWWRASFGRICHIHFFLSTPFCPPILKPNLDKQNKIIAYLNFQYLDADFRQAYFRGKLFSCINIWIMGFLECSLQLVELESRKCCTISTVLLLWLLRKQRLLFSFSNAFQIYFQYFLSYLSRVWEECSILNELFPALQDFPGLSFALALLLLP